MVFYELVAGRHPFTADTTLGYLHAITSHTPLPLSNVAGALDSLISRMLAKDATTRPTAGEVHAVLAAIERSDIAPALGSAQAARQSIAVLPFANMSAEKDQEYFADGLAEEIINLLAQVAGLKVIARTSAFAFRGKEQDIRGIAEILGVRTILEGSVRRAGSRVRVTAQLVNAADGSHLWSQRFDRELTDVFAVQDEIAIGDCRRSADRRLRRTSDKRGYKPAFAAYEALLRARHHFNQLTPESMARGQESVERAIALDPGFAAPHAELSLQYGVMAASGHAIGSRSPAARQGGGQAGTRAGLRRFPKASPTWAGSPRFTSMTGRKPGGCSRWRWRAIRRRRPCVNSTPSTCCTRGEPAEASRRWSARCKRIR